VNNMILGEIVEEDNSFLNINEKNLPRVLQNQIEGINKISESIKDAEEKAKLCEEKAQNALGKDINWLGMGTKDAIYSTQIAVKHTSEAVQSIIDVQHKTLDFQKKLSEITKHLFMLGVSNLVKNRTIVRELELSLKGASKDKISELARKELMLVIKQLKDQEDILIKQEKSEENLKELKNKLSLLGSTSSQKISKLEIENKELRKNLTNHNKNIDDIHKKLKKFEELEELKKKYNNLVDELSLLDNSSSQKISKLEIENKELSKTLTKQNKNIGDIHEKLKRLEDFKGLEKKYNNLVWVSVILAFVIIGSTFYFSLS